MTIEGEIHLSFIRKNREREEEIEERKERIVEQRKESFKEKELHENEEFKRKRVWFKVKRKKGWRKKKN
jgi:hypothetical protein